MHFHVCFVYISVDHRVVMSLETMDFFPDSTASKKLVKLARVQDVENCDSSAFVAFWLGPNQVRYTALLPSNSGPMPLKFLKKCTFLKVKSPKLEPFWTWNTIVKDIRSRKTKIATVLKPSTTVFEGPKGPNFGFLTLSRPF